MFSVYHDLTDKLAVMGKLGWQNWEAFGHLGTTIHGQYYVAKGLTLGGAHTLVDAGDAPFNTERGLARGNLVGHYRPSFIHGIGLDPGKRF